jgi:hypothetical protein
MQDSPHLEVDRPSDVWPAAPRVPQTIRYVMFVLMVIFSLIIHAQNVLRTVKHVIQTF